MFNVPLSAPAVYHGFWLYFWMSALIVAGATFAGITLIVAVKGGGELLAMFRQRRSR